MKQSVEQAPNSARHIVIVGGGFAGLHCAQKLAANPDVRVTLLDKNNYQQFQPLLYQVASSLLAPGNIAFNLRVAVKNRQNVDIRRGAGLEKQEGPSQDVQRPFIRAGADFPC
jgi:NADH dehydrogenase